MRSAFKNACSCMHVLSEAAGCESVSLPDVQGSSSLQGVAA